MKGRGCNHEDTKNTKILKGGEGKKDRNKKRR
jgi:hypothetical protein